MDDSLRSIVRRRAHGRCEYCRLPEEYSQQVFEIDHIIARKHKGKTVLGNISWACFACNNHKSANIAGVCPITKRIVKLYHPRRHKWSRHFCWRAAFLFGKTPIGRATIDVLEINLPYRIALREALIKEGVSFEVDD